jgi:putative copper resistance protein D
LDLIALRLALYAVLFAQFGISAFGLYALQEDERGSGHPFCYRIALPVIAALALAVGLFDIVVHLASMAGTSWCPVDLAMLRAMLNETDLGMAWQVRIAAPIAALAGSVMLRNRISPLLALHLVCGGVAIATLTWSGHAGATEGSAGTIHRINDTIHMLAAAVWFGGLLSFVSLLFIRDTALNPALIALAARSLGQFSRVGTIAVAVIVVTGIVNSAMTFGLGNLTNLERPYAALLAAKLFLFTAMLACAALNRWRLTPAFVRNDKTPGAAIARLRLSLLIETGAAVLLLATVAWLGTLAPLPL